MSATSSAIDISRSLNSQVDALRKNTHRVLRRRESISDEIFLLRRKVRELENLLAEKKEKEIARSVFEGPDAVLNFLDPASLPMPPLVEFPAPLNLFADEGVRIFGKMLQMTPLANVKSWPSFFLLNEAKKRGELENVHTLIESSSGNTALGLAVVGRLLGIERFVAIVDDTISENSLRTLQLFGADLHIHPTPQNCDDPVEYSRVRAAKEWGSKPGCYNPDQYDHADNPNVHTCFTGPQIWEQTQGKISVFSTSLGTCGTMCGTAAYLKAQNPKLMTVGTVRSPNTYVPGPRTLRLLEEVSYAWKDLTVEVEDANPQDSYTQSLEMIRNGLLAGPSSGLTLVGTNKFLDRMKQTGRLDSLRNKDGEIVIVMLICDTPLQHVDKYFTYVPESYFKQPENAELLDRKNSPSYSKS